MGPPTYPYAITSTNALVHYAEEHMHSVAYVYPTTATARTITAATTAWVLGTAATIVTASTIASVFDIHAVYVEGASANDTYEIVFYRASSVVVGVCRFVKINTFTQTIVMPMITPKLPANSEITAKAKSASGGGDTITISILYHTY